MFTVPDEALFSHSFPGRERSIATADPEVYVNRLHSATTELVAVSFEAGEEIQTQVF